MLMDDVLNILSDKDAQIYGSMVTCIQLSHASSTLVVYKLPV